MKIGIIGAGYLARAAARSLVRARYDVMISNRRSPRGLLAISREIGCLNGTVDDAAAFSDVVLIAIPFHAYSTLPAALLASKIVIDAGNYIRGRDGVIYGFEEGAVTTSELLAHHLPSSKIVKALNAIAAVDIERDGRALRLPDRRAIPIAGDDAAAKQTVTDLLDVMGYNVLDVGSLSQGWRFEANTPAFGIAHTWSALADALQAATRPLRTSESAQLSSIVVIERPHRCWRHGRSTSGEIR